MAGLINSTQGMPTADPQAASPQAQMTSSMPAAGGKISNPVLAQIVAGVEAKVSPQLKKQYIAITTASMKMMADPRASAGIIHRLERTPDVLKNVADGVSNFLGQLYLESGKRMSLPAAMPASIYIACHVMDIAEAKGMIKITPDNAADCIHATTDATMKVFGISDEQVHQAVSAGHQAAQKQQGQPAQPMQAGA